MFLFGVPMASLSASLLCLSLLLTPHPFPSLPFSSLLSLLQPPSACLLTHGHVLTSLFLTLLLVDDEKTLSVQHTSFMSQQQRILFSSSCCRMFPSLFFLDFLSWCTSRLLVPFFPLFFSWFLSILSSFPFSSLTSFLFLHSASYSLCLLWLTTRPVRKNKKEACADCGHLHHFLSSSTHHTHTHTHTLSLLFIHFSTLSALIFGRSILFSPTVCSLSVTHTFILPTLKLPTHAITTLQPL